MTGRVRSVLEAIGWRLPAVRRACSIARLVIALQDMDLLTGACAGDRGKMIGGKMDITWPLPTAALKGVSNVASIGQGVRNPLEVWHDRSCAWFPCTASPDLLGLPAVVGTSNSALLRDTLSQKIMSC